MELLITQKDGTKHVVLYDECDHGLVSSHKWHVNSDGYVLTTVKFNGKDRKALIHRLILGLTDPKIKTDHIHHNKLDNRRSEIRACTHKQNMKNRTSYGASRYLGVYLLYRKYKGKKNGPYFRADININGKQTYIGIFKTEIAAAIAYDEKAKEIHGGFANLNFK